jgi:hypothetical protein
MSGSEVNRSPGPAPWGTKRRMRSMAVFGLTSSGVLLLLGLLDLAVLHRKASVVLGLAICLIVFWAVAIPLARHRGKV